MLNHYSPYEKVNEKERITSIYFTFPTFGNHYHLLLTQFLLGTCRVSAAKLKEGIKNPLKKKSYVYLIFKNINNLVDMYLVYPNVWFRNSIGIYNLFTFLDIQKTLLNPRWNIGSSSICDYCIFNSCFIMSISIRKFFFFTPTAASNVKRISRKND